MQFFACLLLIGYAGVKLTIYGDTISHKTGLGGNWIGFLLMATVTSIPELASGISAVTLAGAPDIAIGTLLGSCVFNLVIIVILDLLYRPTLIYRMASVGHVLSGGFGIVLIGVCGLGLILAHAGETLGLGHIGIYTPVILLLYIVTVRTVFSYENRQIEAYAEQEADAYPSLSLKSAMLRYLVAAMIVVVTGIWLPLVAKKIALIMHWQESFVGTLLVAFITSLPEMVVAVTAIKIHALDMAIGNIFGSNLFNIAVVAIEDICYRAGPILAAVSPVHLLSILTSLVMTGFAIIGLFYRAERRVFKLVGWNSWLLFALYLFNSYFLFIYG
ncbi:sodium:calcium antiporter [Methylomarinum sp. Ch1-1]|uniref:Sodium:calcium antiporter n=1 Tax=Methylomarinum roseum TaxID=3067653 RepID=A0AAU7NRC3_9GAMM|nr:sodium:calcium antiporter [Methylomarinum sp. Ch1-1]MDP4520514.1 sodium:calcium antiporter [Methylomarinum sp. Ch1-1]